MRSNSRVILLVSLLTASCCATLPAERSLPPAEFLVPCQEPAQGYKTNGGMARYQRDLLDALRGCSRQLDGIRSWAQE